MGRTTEPFGGLGQGDGRSRFQESGCALQVLTLTRLDVENPQCTPNHLSPKTRKIIFPSKKTSKNRSPSGTFGWVLGPPWPPGPSGFSGGSPGRGATKSPGRSPVSCTAPWRRCGCTPRGRRGGLQPTRAARGECAAREARRKREGCELKRRRCSAAVALYRKNAPDLDLFNFFHLLPGVLTNIWL